MFRVLPLLFVCALVSADKNSAQDEDFSQQGNFVKDHPFYKLVPLKIGVQVSGVNLSKDPSPELLQQLVKDVYDYKLLVFKDQGEITAKRHLEIAHWLGDEVDTQHRQHKKAEHKAVFRVSYGS